MSKIAKYETRLSRRLPAVSMKQITYLKQKYYDQLCQLIRFYNALEQKRVAEDDYIDKLFTVFYWEAPVTEIKNISAFENWVIDYLDDFLYWDKDHEQMGYNSIVQAITAGRIFRTRIFDTARKKYYQLCVNALGDYKLNVARRIVSQSFETAEEIFENYLETESGFVFCLKNAINRYREVDNLPEIELKSF